MRSWRQGRILTALEWKKDNARSYAGVYLRRGLLSREPCEVCGEEAEMHHDDYDKPLEVRWLCRVHHLAHHSNITPPLTLESTEEPSE